MVLLETEPIQGPHLFLYCCSLPDGYIASVVVEGAAFSESPSGTMPFRNTFPIFVTILSSLDDTALSVFFVHFAITLALTILKKTYSVFKSIYGEQAQAGSL